MHGLYRRYKRFLTESKNDASFILLGHLFIYLVMAAQFESWLTPLLSSGVPLAGAVITLGLIKGDLNLYSTLV